MNVVRFIGGIGNQMFQYAFGLRLMSTGKQVIFDVSWYKSRTATNPQFPRPFCLHYFQTEYLVLGDLVRENATVDETRVGYNMGLFTMKNENNFKGYWQYKDYFLPLLPQLKKEYQLRTDVYTDKFIQWADKIFKCESVAMHVRRGDYQLHRVGRFRDLPAQYYFDAMEKIPAKDVFVFSDDIKWCERVFQNGLTGKRFHFVNMPDFYCFELMRLCQHKIITNSTFSYWAAVLGDSGMIICPENWLGSPLKEASMHYLDHWIKIKDYARHIA